MPVTNLSSLSFKLTLWYLVSDTALGSSKHLSFTVSLVTYVTLSRKTALRWHCRRRSFFSWFWCYIFISLDPVHGPLLVCVCVGGDIGWYSSPAHAQLEQYIGDITAQMRAQRPPCQSPPDQMPHSGTHARSSAHSPWRSITSLD